MKSGDKWLFLEATELFLACLIKKEHIIECAFYELN